MLKEVRELALEKFAGDQDLADQFVAGFVAHIALEKQAQLEKEAQGGRGPAMTPQAAGYAARQQRPDADVSRDFMEGFANQIGKGVAGVSANMGIGALIVGTRFVKDQFRYQHFLKALDQAINSHPLLREQPKAKVQKYADTIYKFAPLVAVDPNLLASVLANAVHGDGIDLMTIKSLTDLEGRYRDNGAVNPKTFI